MSQLQDNLNEIKRQKDLYLLPENIKKDVTVLGVTGTLDTSSGSGDVKLFETVEEMQADSDAEKGDLAIIYREETQPVAENSRFSSCIFPNTVVLDEPYTDGMYGYFYNTDEKGPYFVGEIGLYYDEFKFDTQEGDTNIHISYTSGDGITYIRTDGGEKLQEFGTSIMWGPEQSYAFNNTIGNFMRIGGDCFHGLYIGTGNASGNKYKLADTQFTAVPNVVYNETFYSKNGVETGTLTTNISNAFDDTNAEVYAKVQQQYNNIVPRVLTDEDKTIDTNIKIIPSKSDGTSLFNTSNVTNMYEMFYDCTSLTFISNLDTSNVTDMGYTFEDCTSLTTIPLFNTSNVTDMRAMFYDCASLTSIPLLNTSNVIEMGNMFEECASLTSIPLLNTSNVTDMLSMFEDCTSLTSIPLLDTSNVISMGSMFVRCTNLTSIPLLDTSNVNTMNFMFKNCTSLTTIPLFNTSNVTGMNSMFEDCVNLTSIPLLDTNNVTDMRYMFENCTSLTTIPLLNTSNVTDIEYMFRNCTSLNNESLNNILAMCTNATKITSNKTLARIGLTQEQATTCTTLSNYQAFLDAGWTIGY